MDSARPGDPQKFLSLEETAKKLAVSVDVLLKWNEQNILKPSITPTGEVGYTEEQLTHFLKIKEQSTPSNPLSETLNQAHETPGRADRVRPNLYQRFVHWIGKGFYEDEFIKEYFKSQVKHSLTFSFEKPSFKLPSRRVRSITLGCLLLIGLLLFTQQ